jgi:hypothetical protein
MARQDAVKGPAIIGGGHCLAPARTVDAPIDGTAGRYSRLFPDLPPLEGGNAALLSLGVAGGVCDAGETRGYAVETAAGWPMFGQYVAHDITADRSPIAPQAQLARIANFRSPRANLESLYGSVKSAALTCLGPTTPTSCCSVPFTVGGIERGLAD